MAMTEINSIGQHFLLAALLLAILRLVPLWLAGRFETGDMRAHRLFIERERAHPFVMWRSGRNYLFLFHSLMAFTRVPPRLLSVWLPLVSDLAVLAVLYGVVIMLSGQGALSPRAAIMLAYAHALYPGHLVPQTGPRSYGLNERIVGESLFVVLALLALLAPPQWWVLALLTLLVLVLLFSSRFASQAIAFLLLPTLLITASWPQLGAVVAGWVLALSWPGAHFSERLRLHVDHVLFYRRFVDDPRLWIGRRNRPPRCTGRETWRRRARGWLAFLLHGNGVSAGMLWHFPVLMAALAWLAAPGRMPWAEGLAVLVFLGIGLWLLSCFGRFKIIGEAERYLGYVAVPALLLLVLAWPAPPSWVLAAYVAAAVAAWIYGMLRLRALARRARMHEAGVQPLIRHLRQALAPHERIAAALPTHDLWVLLEAFWERLSWHDVFLRLSWRESIGLYPHPSAEFLRRWGYDVFVTTDEILRELLREDPGMNTLLAHARRDSVGPYLIFRLNGRGGTA